MSQHVLATSRKPTSWSAQLGRMLSACGAALALVVGFSSSAAALPPGGASPDTAGTASSVGARTVSVGDALTFTVTGFPANHVISVKIADGQYCGSGVRYGSCVVTRVNSDANGRASGTIVVPDDLTTGSYWLRFLTDTPATTNRGSSDFNVVAQGAATASDGSTSQQVQETTSVGDGEVVMLPAPAATDVAKSVADDELPIAGGASTSGAESGESTASQDDAGTSGALGALASEGADAASFPWLGASVFGGTLLMVAAAVTALLIWPRRAKASRR